MVRRGPKVAAITIPLVKSDETYQYLVKCARIRDITMSALCKRIVDHIAADQLVNSVLDDTDNLLEKRPGEHKYRDI